MTPSLSTSPSAFLCWLHCHVGFSFILPAWPHRWKENSPFPQLEPKSHGSLPLPQCRSPAYPCQSGWQRDALIGRARVTCLLLTKGWRGQSHGNILYQWKGKSGTLLPGGAWPQGRIRGGLPAAVRGVLSCIRVGKKGGDCLQLPSRP